MYSVIGSLEYMISILYNVVHNVYYLLHTIYSTYTYYTVYYTICSMLRTRCHILLDYALRIPHPMRAQAFRQPPGAASTPAELPHKREKEREREREREMGDPAVRSIQNIRWCNVVLNIRYDVSGYLL